MIEIMRELANKYFRPYPSVDHLIGKRYTNLNGESWELVSHNDLNVPYFSKVLNGKVQKKKYTIAWLEAEVFKEA
jgi:hypothetical protein